MRIRSKKEEEVRYFVAKLIYNDLHLIYIKYFLFKSLVIHKIYGLLVLFKITPALDIRPV